MTLPFGFSLFGEQPPPQGNDRLWEIVDVCYGQGSDWTLQVRLESGGRLTTVMFDEVVSFRAQDEGDILNYWRQREREGVAVGTLYVIESSAYKDEFQT